MKRLIICAAAMLGLASTPLHATTIWEFNVAAQLSGTSSTYNLTDDPSPQVTTAPFNDFMNFKIDVLAFDTTTSFTVAGRDIPACDRLQLYECSIWGTLRFDNGEIFIDTLSFAGSGYREGCGFFACYPYTDIEATGGSRIAGFAESFDGPAPIPEPATWAMMLLGFGALGLTVRRSRSRRGSVGRYAGECLMKSVFTKVLVATAVFFSAAANATVFGGTGDPLNDPNFALGAFQINFNEEGPIGQTLPYSEGGVAFTAVDTAPIAIGIVPNADLSGYFATEGGGGNPIVTFTFDQPTSAVAFNLLFDASWTFSIYSNNQLLDSVDLSSVTFTPSEYVGLSGTRITSATLARNSGEIGNILIDNLTYSLPEPETWAMMLLGFGAIGWQLRRRRRVDAGASAKLVPNSTSI